MVYSTCMIVFRYSEPYADFVPLQNKPSPSEGCAGYHGTSVLRFLSFGGTGRS